MAFKNRRRLLPRDRSRLVETRKRTLVWWFTETANTATFCPECGQKIITRQQSLIHNVLSFIMAAPLGTAFLSSMARLEHPRETPGPAWHPAVTFDALLPCQNNNAISPIVCNARYIRGPGEHVQPGIYQVFLEIVAYESNVDMPCPVRNDNDFMFLAEIISIRHLDLPFHFNLLESYIPLIIVAMGVVGFHDHNENGFTVALTQTIGSHTPPGTLTAHIVSVFDPAGPQDAITAVNENVAFSGELLNVEHAEPIFKLRQFVGVVNGVPQGAIF